MEGDAFDFSRFDALTFDTYGTLIDWERGILDALQPVVAFHDVEVADEELLEIYARHEARVEAGKYQRYRDVLGQSLRGLCADIEIKPTKAQVAAFSTSVGAWPAFPDSARALRKLATRFRLGVITNCDDDLFAASNLRLGVDFEWIVTAQTAKDYKPSLRNFEVAFERIDIPRDRILHVAQSLFHDHAPAKALGLSTVWVDRRHGKPGFGATPPAEATPDLTVPDMRSLADLAVPA